MMGTRELTEERWRAIVSNDASYDRRFFYAIRTTGIFCKPSCKSKIPRPENVRIFHNAEEALSANFRPCKRCKPTEARLPDQEWVDQMKDYIHRNYRNTLRLQTIADHCHGSPFHLHRMFKRIAGITPTEYIQRVRIVKAAESLLHSDKTIEQISAEVGIPNPSYFITLFKKTTGLTPKAFRLSAGRIPGRT